MHPTQLTGGPAGLALEAVATATGDYPAAPAAIGADRTEESVRPVGVATTISYLPELESMRGIAMLMVVLFHTNEFLRWRNIPQTGEQVGLVQALIRGGDDGVGLFFVLSAFLLALPFLLAAREQRRVDVQRFWLRRALRILPLYYAFVIAGIALTSRSLQEAWSRYPYFLFPNGSPIALPDPMPPFSNVWWSLETEAEFYLLLPLLAPALASRRGRLIGAGVVLVYLALFAFYQSRIVHPGSIRFDMNIALSLFGRGPFFLLGIAAAALYVRHGERLKRRAHDSPWLRGGGGDLALVAVGLSIALLLQWKIAAGPPLSRVPPLQSYQVIQALQFAALILVVLILPLRLKPLIHNRFLEHLGVLSYSAYMLHVPIIYTGIMWLRQNGMREMTDWHPSSAIMAASLLVLTYEASRLTYRFIEQPFLRRKEKVRG